MANKKNNDQKTAAQHKRKNQLKRFESNEDFLDYFKEILREKSSNQEIRMCLKSLGIDLENINKIMYVL